MEIANENSVQKATGIHRSITADIRHRMVLGRCQERRMKAASSGETTHLAGNAKSLSGDQMIETKLLPAITANDKIRAQTIVYIP